MSFNRGDQVVHPTHGVGVVEGIQGMDFPGGSPRDYYRVEFPHTTIWVSVADQQLSALRSITPKNQLYRFRSLLTGSPARRDNDFRSRHQELEHRVTSGTFGSLCELVRDLSAWHFLKPLNDYERNLLKRSRSFLAAEWSITSGLEMHEAMEEIEGCLLEGRQLTSPE